MEVYYITILVIIIFGLLRDYFYEKKRIVISNFFLLFPIAILVIVSGLRFDIGTDYMQYSINYEVYKESQFSDLYFEPGIKVIAIISSLIYDSYITMIFLCAFITIMLFIITIVKNNKTVTYGVLLFIFMGLFHGSFNGIRQYLACSILFFGHSYIIERKFKKYLFVVLISSLFHITSLFGIIFYFVNLYKINIKYMLIIFVLMIVLYFITPYAIYILNYFKFNEFRFVNNDYFDRNVNLLRVIIRIIPIFIFVLFTDKTKLSSNDELYVKILIFNAFLSVITMGSALLFRITIYSNAFSILAYPSILNNRDKKLNLMLKYFTLIFFFLYWYIEVYNSPDLNPFKWVFNI